MYDKNKAYYVVATCIIIKNGKFLITKRASKEKAFPNQWTVPGGKLEVSDYINRKKETSQQWYNVLENLARREIFEETGLQIKSIRYLVSLVYIRPDNIPTLVVSMYANYGSGEVKLSPDLTEYAWVTLEEAKNYQLIEGIYEELETLDKILKTGKFQEWNK